ncbi:MAG: hypothetical protein QGH40_04040, partial [bacterium]|nr:hypothetical protein [bacterium]
MRYLPTNRFIYLLLAATIFLAASIPEAASAAQTIKGSVSLKEGSVQPLRPVPNIFVELSGGGTSYRTLTNAEGQFIFDTTGIDHNCFEALINFEAVLKPIAAGPDIAVVSKTELDTRGPTKAFPLTGLKKEIRNTFIPLVVDPGVAPDTAQALETILAFRRTMAAAVKAARPYGTELVTAIESISRQKHILIPVGAGENPVIRFPSKPGETVLLTIPSSDSDGRTMALALANEAVHLLLAKHPLARKLPLQWVQVLPSRSPGGTQGDELRHELAALVCRMLSFNLPDIPSGLAPIFLAPSTTVTPEELFRLIRDRQIGSLKGLLSLLSKTTKPSVKRIAKQPVVSPEALEELEQLRQRLKELQARWEKAYSQITKGTMLFSQFMTEVGALESRLAGLAGPETVALARNITAPSLIEQWISRWNQKSPALKGRLKNSANKYIQEAASFYKDIDGKVRMVKESKRQSKAEVESMETRLGEIITGFFTGFNTLLEEIHTSKTNRWYSIWLNPSRHVSTLENRLLEALDLVDRIEQEFLETDAPGREKIPKRLGTLIQQINREIFHLKGKIVRTEMLASASDNTADHLHQIHKTYTSSATPLLKQYRALITTKGHRLET